MNKGDFYIFSVCTIHLFIWLFVVFGGFFSKKILFVNVFILLPMVYITQAQKNHPIAKEKIKYILNNMNQFSDPEPFVSYCYNKIEPKEIQHLSEELGASEKDVIKATLIMQSYDNCLGIPKLLILVYRNFCDSYRNPLDPQGLIVLGFIINSWAFFFKGYKL
jgi:hypothetical protein